MTVEDTPLPAMTTPHDDAPLQQVEHAYRNVLRTQYMVTAIPLAIAAFAIDAAILQYAPFRWLPTVASWLLAAIVITVVPGRKYRHVGYQLSERTIRIVRGFVFHVDTVVPFVRVQHIDVARGPVERMFGVASLVIHTAGTHNSIVTLPGLSPESAADIRDTIRSHIRSDSE